METGRIPMSSVASATLQFGHGIAAMETRREGDWRHGVMSASIRPWHRCHGDEIRKSCESFSVIGFNSAMASPLWRLWLAQTWQQRRGGFNSAMASLPWRPVAEAEKEIAKQKASIRPWHRCHG